MKRTIYLLLCGLATVCTACRDEAPDMPDLRLYTPEVSDITATEAVIGCRAAVDLSTFAGITAGIACCPEGTSDTRYVTARGEQISGDRFSVDLTELAPETEYTAYAYLQAGSLKVYSQAVSFMTKVLTDDNTPVLEPVSGTEIAIPAEGGSAEILYSIRNPRDGCQTEIACSQTWIGDIAERPQGRIAFSAEPNTGAERTAEIVLIYPDAEPLAFLVRQAEGAGGETQSLNLFTGWAELPAAAERTGWYYAWHMTDVRTQTGANARNYSVCYSREKMCAIWIAAPMHPFYAEKNTSRSDAYKNDPAIPFEQPGKWDGYTRGHLLGSGERLVSRTTNEQVFYHSNIAPQLSTYFNTGGGAWNTLEEWVDTQWASSSDTTYQVIGCWWDPSAEPKIVNGTEVPTHYYKVLLRTKGHSGKWVKECSRDELQCIAILMEHREYAKSEVPQTAQYAAKGLLRSVREMEELTGVTFFGNVPNAPKDEYDPADWGF